MTGINLLRLIMVMLLLRLFWFRVPFSYIVSSRARDREKRVPMTSPSGRLGVNLQSRRFQILARLLLLILRGLPPSCLDRINLCMGLSFQPFSIRRDASQSSNSG